jgi:hypothetical protein
MRLVVAVKLVYDVAGFGAGVGEESFGARERAIQSLRLRLHSSLRQSGRRLRRGCLWPG